MNGDSIGAGRVVTVFGGSGFLGNLVVQKLISKGEQVVSLDVWDFPGQPKEVEFVKGDVLDRDLDLIAREPGHGERDAPLLRLAIGARHLLDVVGRIGVAGGLAGPVDHALKLVEAEEQWRRKQRNARHRYSPS